MPKISVIVPIYNVEKYINRCVDSILNQTFSDFELILVDDGSPDNCGTICNEYAEKDNRIYAIHKKNGGLSDARNAGIEWAFEHSDSEWLTFIDSDDWIHPKYLEALYNAINETGCEISICGYEETTGDNPFVDDSKLQAVTVNTEIFFCEHNVNAVVAWGKLYKKELFREIRYPVGKLHEDEFTTYKLLFDYNTLAVVAEPMYFYYINESSITKSQWHPGKMDIFEALDENLGVFKNQNKYNAYILTIKKAMWSIMSQADSIKLNSDKKALKYMQNFTKRVLKIGEKECLYSFPKDVQYYEIAYPIEMRVYWYWQVFKRKLKRK